VSWSTSFNRGGRGGRRGKTNLYKTCFLLRVLRGSLLFVVRIPGSTACLSARW
jgi:hypothetical protein